jgi:hypothetical protein
MNHRFDKRKARRRAIVAIADTLEWILELEIACHHSIPDSEANERRRIESEFMLGCLQCAVEDLREIK